MSRNRTALRAQKRKAVRLDLPAAQQYLEQRVHVQIADLVFETLHCFRISRICRLNLAAIGFVVPCSSTFRSKQLAMILEPFAHACPDFKNLAFSCSALCNAHSVLALHSFLRYWKRDLRHTRFLEIGSEREPDAVPAKFGWRKFGDER